MKRAQDFTLVRIRLAGRRSHPSVLRIRLARLTIASASGGPHAYTLGYIDPGGIGALLAQEPMRSAAWAVHHTCSLQKTLTRPIAVAAWGFVWSECVALRTLLAHPCWRFCTGCA